MPVDVRTRSFLLFIYFSAGNGGSGVYPAQRLATLLAASIDRPNKRPMTFDNFIIRPIRNEDSLNYHSLVDQNKVRLSKYFPKTLIATEDLESTTAHILERIRLTETKEFFTFVIFENLSKKIIGTIFLKELDWNIPKGEIGFFIDQSYEGKGIITKSVSLVKKHCFDTLGLNKLYMRIAEENISSKRVAEKNGFEVEGILRKDFKTSEGKLIDLVYYGLLKDI